MLSPRIYCRQAYLILVQMKMEAKCIFHIILVFYARVLHLRIQKREKLESNQAEIS